MTFPRLIPFLLCALSTATLAQSSADAAPKAPPAHVFARFLGEWTLKDDAWSQNWGGAIENIKIPNHHTTCSAINTDNTVLCVVDTPPAGHILWAFNPVKKEVRHLSSFGELRIGTGQGSLNDKGDLRLKISFEGEAPETYRIYDYVWINADEYDMRSVQHDASGKKTGLFYGGRFIRKTDSVTDKTRIERIFAAHDKLQPGLDEYMASVASDVILMPNGGAAIEGKAAYLQHVKDFYASGTIQIRHELIEVYSYSEVVIARGRAIGSFTPPGGSTTNTFETRNVFIFRRLASGNLEVSQIIFNNAPPSRQ